MQQRIHELMELCTILQRQQSYMAAKIKDQDKEISELKARVNFLEDKESRNVEPTQEVAPITGGIISMEAMNILTSRGAAASVSPSDVLLTVGVPTVSGSFPTVCAIFTTASVEQIDAQVAREMEEEFARENQRLSEQLARDFEITRLHAEEELKIMIEGLKIDQRSAKRVKTSKSVSEDVSEEELKRIMQLVPLEEVYVEALQMANDLILKIHNIANSPG
nr:hypothetical protein [Tanacetum cinerariifolium]